jgi:hypothetical protein
MSMLEQLEDLLRDGGDEAVTLVLHEAIERNDLPMIARITKMINNRAKSVETLMASPASREEAE